MWVSLSGEPVIRTEVTAGTETATTTVGIARRKERFLAERLQS